MKIKCPECSQKFDVTEDFLGKTVECGSCDNRFKVTDAEVLAEKQRFYPGEKKGAYLDNFGTSAASIDAPVRFQQAHYQKPSNNDIVSAPHPGRIMAALAGVLLMISVILIFLFTSNGDGGVGSMKTLNRFVLVGFAALVGGGLLCYGTTRNKKAGWLAAVVLSIGLLSLPVFFPGKAEITATADYTENFEEIEAKEMEEEVSTNDYLFEIGYSPVEKAIKGAKPDTVVAIYLRDASALLRNTIASYLYEATDKVSRETSYERGTTGQKGLILLVDQEKSLDEIALLCEKFGRITKISRDHRVIDVTVEQSKIGSLNEDTALDSESLSFQRESLKALQSIDPDVQMKTVMRLANSEPKALRPDVTEQMVAMLPKASKELQLELIKGIAVWSQTGDGSESAVMIAVQELYQDEVIEKDVIEFLITREVSGVDVVLVALWKKNPVAWTDTIKKLGEGAQILLLPILPELDEKQLVVAAGILGDTGSKAVVEHIEAAIEQSPSEAAQKAMQTAIEKISARP